MPSFVFPLEAPELVLANAGGKGANLRLLLDGRFPVPNGFVITTDAYRAFVAGHNLQTQIVTLCQQAQPNDMASFEEAEQAIRALFSQVEWPTAVQTAVLEAYRPFAHLWVAVRSSATAEDLPGASFAGQQESYLHIRGEEAFLTAVRHCWSSLWTARAMAYRLQQGIPPQEVSLAVVVQEMVPAEVAGVVFTTNPVNGRSNQVLINASWGLGEALVTGQVNPDTYTADKASGRIQEVLLGDKQVMTAPTATGTTTTAVSASKQSQQTLTAFQVSQITDMARAIETAFQCPQDIEWAISERDHKLYILQTRPITAIGGVPGDDAWPPLDDGRPQPFDLWTQMDVGERWPEPVTPFTWSTAVPMINQNMQDSDSIRLLKDPNTANIQWAKRVYGRVYFNEGAMGHIFSHYYGMPTHMMASSLGAQGVPGGKDRMQWGIVMRRLPVLTRTTLKWQADISRFEKHFQTIDQWVEEFQARDHTLISDADLWREANGIWEERLMHSMNYHAEMTSISGMNLVMLQSALDRWLNDKEIVYTLLMGLDGVIAASIVPQLWQMATAVRQAGLADIVLQQPPATALAELRLAPQAAPFLHLFEQFLRDHGHRCITEAELLYPRWREAPELVVELVANYLRMENHTPSEVEGKQRQQRQATTAEVEAKLTFWQKPIFRGMLQRVQHLVRMRDNGQNYVVKLLMPIRQIYALLAERWAERGWLTLPEDFFFLVLPEVETIVQAGSPEKAGLDVPVLVARRRKAYRYWFNRPVPEVLDADGQPLQLTAVDPTIPEGTLVGIAASAGQVKARARVILNPRDASTQLQPGDILVTRATDPGWTPIFSIIGGLVLEVGGQLSHGAIVAREYGLPAVVNVAEATQKIEDGRFILVDGTTGRVTLVPD